MAISVWAICRILVTYNSATPSEYWKHRYYAGAASLKPRMNGTIISNSTLLVISCIISECWSKAPFLDFNDLFEQSPESLKKKKVELLVGCILPRSLRKFSVLKVTFKRGFKRVSKHQHLHKFYHSMEWISLQNNPTSVIHHLCEPQIYLTHNQHGILTLV